MSENSITLPQLEEGAGINPLDMLIVVVAHKKKILSVTLLVAILATWHAFTQPNIYTATTKILPPQQAQSSASAMLSQLGGLAGGMLGGKSPNDLYVAMLKSRNITEKVAQRFDLQKVYATQTATDALKVLEVSTSVVMGRDGLISVDVDDKDPRRAAELANAYIEELGKLMQTFAFSEAAQRRQFFETQLKPARAKLTDAEITLDRTPNTSLHYMDALRNLKYQESMYEVLAKQFEMAKLDEVKDAPSIQVLDKAVVPEKKSKPKRSLMVIFPTLAAFFLAVIGVLIFERMARAVKQPEQQERMRQLRRVWGGKV